MIQPPSPVPGDTVFITGTGRKIDRESIAMATQILESWGAKVEIAPTLFNDSHSYLAGTDSERLADLQSAIDNDDIKCIICARGGYGTTRILEQLDLSSLKRNPKWIVGFSDITALHLKLASQGLQSIHAIMPVLFTKPDAHDSLESLRLVLSGAPVAMRAPADRLNRPGVVQARAVGGNLSLIVDSLGTPSAIDTHGKILVIEEINEFYYKIDRMLMQLQRAGKLAPLAGLVVGYMTDIQDTNPSFGETVEDIIFRVVKAYDFPVAFKFPIGHEHPNLAFVHGRIATLDVSTAGAVFTQSRYPASA
jgi:muramoyltetrapeptide carboxypeptidase